MNVRSLLTAGLVLATTMAWLPGQVAAPTATSTAPTASAATTRPAAQSDLGACIRAIRS